MEEFILRNFTQLFENQIDLPLNLIVEPVVAIFSERIKNERTP